MTSTQSDRVVTCPAEVGALGLVGLETVLGVSVERVRQLVVGGQLPGRRFGNAWVVPKDAVAARRYSPGVRGRPLGPVKAWQELLAGSIGFRHPGRYQRRANIIRGEMSRADAAALPAMVGAMLGGARAAIELRERLSVGSNVDLFLPVKSFASLERHVAFIPDVAGCTALRVVDGEAWRLLAKGALAPLAAVPLDLLESGDPRHWIAGEHLVAGAHLVAGEHLGASDG